MVTKTSNPRSKASPPLQEKIPSLAIACQGGGAHTAFTAGALAYLFLAFQYFEKHAQGLPVHLTGLSGTSGGAITAAMAWSNPGDRTDHWAEGARRVLRFWQRNKANPGILDKSAPRWWNEDFNNALNQFIGLLGNLNSHMPKVQFPTSKELSDDTRLRMREDIRAALKLPAGGERIHGRKDMSIFVGASDIVNEAGRPGSSFTAFTDTPDSPLRVEHLLASVAIPELFLAQEIQEGGKPHYYWDGLYSQNPPINEFFSSRNVAGADEKPDLLWVIQINPSTYEPYDGEPFPTTPREVEDRKNELMGNLSLGHELRNIETINKLYSTLPAGTGDCKKVTYSIIPLGKIEGRPLDYLSKMNRDPDFINELICIGVATAYQCGKDNILMSPLCHREGRQCHAPSFKNPVWPHPRDLLSDLDPVKYPELQEIHRALQLYLPEAP